MKYYKKIIYLENIDTVFIKFRYDKRVHKYNKIINNTLHDKI